jgi:hypothetical protein
LHVLEALSTLRADCIFNIINAQMIQTLSASQIYKSLMMLKMQSALKVDNASNTCKKMHNGSAHQINKIATQWGSWKNGGNAQMQSQNATCL